MHVAMVREGEEFADDAMVPHGDLQWTFGRLA